MTCSSAWDSTPIGRFFHLHLCQNENLSPQLIIEDKVIRSIVHLKNTSTIYFIATLISDDESQRLTYVIDRFLITNDIHNQQLLTGEFPVPIQCDMKSSTMLDTFIQSAIQDMDSYCHSSSSPIQLHRFSYLCGQMLAKYSSSSSSPVNIHFSFNLLTLNNSFKLTPINAPCMQILPTALLKSLSSSTGNSIYKNQAHFGYCSLDRMLRNKILLILENDPQACTLPLIGIWVSGITDIQCSFVWAACLRFCMNSSLNQRLRSENEPFLLACYLSTSHGQCEFYEVKPMTMDSNTIEYDRWACSKQINIPNLPAHELDTSCSTQFPYDFEFRRICDNSNFRASPMKNASAIPLDHYQAIFTSPNTNGSLFGFPRLPPRQSAHEQPSWEVITTAPMLTPKRQSRPSSSSSSSVKSKEFLSPTSSIDVSDNRWKEELIERMQSYETHFLSLTKLVHQLLNAQNQQNLLTTTPKKECSKRDVAVQSEPSSPYFDESFDKTKHHIIRSPNTGHYQQPAHQLTSNQFQSPSSQTTTDQSSFSRS
ncbi:hypothetical protein I4U23_026821 [Adineta vaga]|nr:hypothetical protein I4U23_026821 [Adineta vaga]